MKLACIGPLRPSRTGVADFTENLLPFLADRCEIELFTDGYAPSESPISQRFPVGDIGEFIRSAFRFDGVLYQMGNHYRYHRAVFEALVRVPGVVMLHDCVLNQFFGKYALERGNFGTFRNLFELCYGRQTAESELASFWNAHGDPYRFPMAGAIARCSRGTIVMSEYGKDIVLQEARETPVLKVNFPYFGGPGAPAPVNDFRRKFNVPEGAFIVASMGHMTPAKRIHVAVDAFQELSAKYSNSLFLLAGETSSRYPVIDRIRRGSFPNVVYLGYLTKSELDALMAVADVCINLRYPSTGEMSNALIDMLGCGKVVVVSNHAQFTEFPDDVCIKINLGPRERDDLASELLKLASDDARRSSVGEAARSYIASEHSPEAAAEAISQFIAEHSRSEPLLSPGAMKVLLAPDAPMKRYKQAFAYNRKRFSSFFNEYGLAHTMRTAIERMRARTNAKSPKACG